MHPLSPSALIATLVVVTAVTGVVTAGPLGPGTEGNGLTENESATLWSRDDDNYMNQSTYQRRYDETRSATQQLANGTDITFARPPSTAATWTRNDFADLDAGDANTSVYPRDVTLTSGVLIADAHATIFAAQPSTRSHLGPNETIQYVAPNGTLRGFVDYRVRIPNRSTTSNRTVTHSLVSHEVESVRLLRDGEAIAERDGTHRPTLEYNLQNGGRANLTLEADIRVELAQTVRSTGSGLVVNDSALTETLTVRDSLTVEIYDLSASVYSAEYPNGDTGAAVFQTQPWQGYTLPTNNPGHVRGVWRFYTARDTTWDTLIRANRTEREAIKSDALPVFVHAYPSRIGPRAEPVRNGPEILETWGTNESSPAPSLGENIHVDIVSSSYTASHGVAIRTGDVDPRAIRVTGIVRGVNATITEPDNGFERTLYRSNLTATVLEQNQSTATIQLTLRSANSGEPIVLNEGDRDIPVEGPGRNGYITIADQRVETNASGIAVVTVENPGIYTAQYHSGLWVSQYSAYVGDSATVRWHPLTTLDGWFALTVEVGWQLLPFVVALYAGRRLLALLSLPFSERP